MAGTKEIKRRIKSVKNTKKITKAMELVAASKMKRAVSSTLASRIYSEYSWEVLTSISQSLEENSYPLFTQRNAGGIKNILVVLISSNRSLCGGYNAQVIKKTLSMLRENADANIDMITIGKKGDNAMRRIGKNIIASFIDLPDNSKLGDVAPIAKYVIDEYKAEHYDKVLVAYTDYVSALTQKPNIKQILPISKTIIKELINEAEIESKPLSGVNNNYLFEGDLSALISLLGEKITRMQVYQMLLESRASEESSRMVAMKNASEASGEMIDDLTLVFNKARQSNITREISEISAGMASMS